MPYDNLTIVVSSFDKYAVCWPPFCHGLNKYWPNHPPNLVFITNHLKAPCGRTLAMGEDQGWAPNLLSALDQVETDFILYAQEDYWIRQNVPDQAIQDYLEYLESAQADYIRLYPAPGPDSTWDGDQRLGIIAEDSEYRASLQMALWRKETFISLINPQETPWDFEVKGTKRSRAYGDRFFCVTKRRYGIDYVFTAIVNGYWTEFAGDYALSEGLTIPFEHLSKKPMLKTLFDHVKSFAYKTKKRFIQ